jgi:dienelactone hydrolase
MPEGAMRKRLIRGFAGALALGLLAAACGDDDAGTTPPACQGASCGGGGAAAGPWYDEALEQDTSYLPMGQAPFQRTQLSWEVGRESASVDVYYPEAGNAPVAIMLPGVAVTAERYTWLGSVLASHGIAVAVVDRKGDFASSTHTLATLVELAARTADPASLLAGKLDVSRLLLAGHSQGAVVQAGLTNVATCPGGFCKEGAATPDGIRGLLLMGFHMEGGGEAAYAGPLPAIEAPWLVLGGENDGLTTPEESSKTFARITDRPSHAVTVLGMNHYQFTDYVDPKVDVALDGDKAPSIPNKEARARAAEYAVRFARRVLLGDASVPEDLGAGQDAAVKLSAKPAVLSDPGGHGLPRVASEPFGPPGLDGDENNVDVVATATFQGAVYLLVRNDVEGAEVFRLTGGALEQVPFPGGATNGIYGNKLLNCLLGSMVVYQDKLWVGFSSGVQGTDRGSTGAEVWTFDGQAWAPVVSNRADEDPEVTIRQISGCAADDGDPTAELTVTGAALSPGAWAGGVLDDIDAGGDKPHIFDVEGNTATTLTVKLNARAGREEFAVCDGLSAGSRLKLRKGLDESGFGQPWNKAITGMAVAGGRLYIGSGLNLDQGAEIYVTEDGATFQVAVPRAFFGTHPSGDPISSSIPTLHASDVTGADLLYFAGTGTQQYGARIGVLDPGGGYTFIIDDAVDADDQGLDEAGMGHDNYQVPSMLTFGGRLWMAAFNYSGLELISTADPFDKGAFRVDVGRGGPLAEGFGSPMQISAYLFAVGDTLWAGTIDLVQTSEELAERSGAAFRTKDLAHWQLATAHGFGFNAVSVSRLFEHDGAIYAVSSGGSLNSRSRFAPLQMYSIRDERTAP